MLAEQFCISILRNSPGEKTLEMDNPWILIGSNLPQIYFIFSFLRANSFKANRDNNFHVFKQLHRGISVDIFCSKTIYRFAGAILTSFPHWHWCPSTYERRCAPFSWQINKFEFTTYLITNYEWKKEKEKKRHHRRSFRVLLLRNWVWLCRYSASSTLVDAWILFFRNSSIHIGCCEAKALNKHLC